MPANENELGYFRYHWGDPGPDGPWGPWGPLGPLGPHLKPQVLQHVVEVWFAARADTLKLQAEANGKIANRQAEAYGKMANIIAGARVEAGEA